MGQLFNTIRTLVAEEKYVIGQLDAAETPRRAQASLKEWQAVTSRSPERWSRELVVLVETGPSIMLEEPNPAIEVEETLPDGTAFKAVWSHLGQLASAAWQNW